MTLDKKFWFEQVIRSMEANYNLGDVSFVPDADKASPAEERPSILVATGKVMAWGMNDLDIVIGAIEGDPVIRIIAITSGDRKPPVLSIPSGFDTRYGGFTALLWACDFTLAGDRYIAGKWDLLDTKYPRTARRLLRRKHG